MISGMRSHPFRVRLYRILRFALVSNMLKRLAVVALVALTFPAAARAQYPAPEQRDFLLKNFTFRSGETLPELRIHYRTVGKPERDAAGSRAQRRA